MDTPRTLLAALAGLALAAAPQAQVVFDTFDDGDVSDVGSFAGGAEGIGAGVGPTTGRTGAEATALNLGVNPGQGGGFAGAVVPGGAGSTDVSGTRYLTFYVRPTNVQAANLPLTLEINLHEDADGNGAFDGADEEYQAVYRLSTGAEYQFVQIPLASFADDNSVFAGADDGFDLSSLFEIVFAFGGLQGPELAVSFDDIVFAEDAAPLSGTVQAYDFFADGDVSDIGTFSETGMGIGVGQVGESDGETGETLNALSVGIDPAQAGAFAGVVIPGGDGTTDVSGATYLTFRFRPTTIQAANLPLTLEINLHEDTNGNGTYEGAAEDEFQAVYRTRTGGDFVDVAIPLASFADDNSVFAGANDGFDFSNLLEIVVAIGGLQGPEFAFALDDVGFTSGMPTASEALPAAFRTAPSVFPNPTASGATVTFELAAPSEVAVDVVDLLGRRVAVVAEGARAAGAVRLAVPTSGLSAGLYLVRVRTAEGVASARLVVTR